MAKQTGSQPLGTAGWLVLGAVGGLLLAGYAQSQVDPTLRAEYDWLPTAGLAAGAFLTYLALCAKRPWIPCWRSKCGTPNKEPGRRRAPFGVRRDCWLCGGKRKWLRPGARVLAVFGYRPRGQD